MLYPLEEDVEVVLGHAGVEAQQERAQHFLGRHDPDMREARRDLHVREDLVDELAAAALDVLRHERLQGQVPAVAGRLTAGTERVLHTRQAHERLTVITLLPALIALESQPGEDVGDLRLVARLDDRSPVDLTRTSRPLPARLFFGALDSGDVARIGDRERRNAAQDRLEALHERPHLGQDGRPACLLVRIVHRVRLACVAVFLNTAWVDGEKGTKEALIFTGFSFFVNQTSTF